jgi:hypothetical protein
MELVSYNNDQNTLERLPPINNNLPGYHFIFIFYNYFKMFNLIFKRQTVKSNELETKYTLANNTFSHQLPPSRALKVCI